MRPWDVVPDVLWFPRFARTRIWRLLDYGSARVAERWRRGRTYDLFMTFLQTRLGNRSPLARRELVERSPEPPLASELGDPCPTGSNGAQCQARPRGAGGKPVKTESKDAEGDRERTELRDKPASI